MPANPTPNLEQKHIKFLEELRDSARTNMWGAAPFLQRKFPELTLSQATDILVAWIASHG